MKKEWIILGLAALIALASVALLVKAFAPLGGGGASPQGITHEQAGAILEELRHIRRLLEARPGRPRPAQALEVPVAGRPALGRADAPVTLVEFTDYQCPFCGRFHRKTFPLLKQKFIDTGKLRFVVMDLPLAMHPNAQRAAVAAHCAGAQGRYFALNDLLFRNQRRLQPDGIAALARRAGLDMKKFQTCTRSQRFLDEVRQSAALAVRLGITGTPSFVLGTAGPDGTVEGRKIVGAQPYTVFEAAISRLLNAAP